MKYFGRIEHPHMEKTDTPRGSCCQWCGEEFEAEASGFMIGGFPRGLVPYHRECFIRSVIGSVGHQQKRCSCYGGKEEDPPGLSKRQAAMVALAEFSLRRGDAEW